MLDYFHEKDTKQEENNSLVGNRSEASKFTSNDIGLDVASLKIIELSKKIRELNAALISERNKCNNLHQTVKRLESSNQSKEAGVCHLCKQSKMSYTEEKLDSTTERMEQEKKLKKLESVVSELRQKVQVLNRDLLLAKKVVEAETGEAIPNISTWLTNMRLKNGIQDGGTCSVFSNWRGRQQQISALKNRIAKLQSQLNAKTISRSEDIICKQNAEDELFSGATSFGISYFQEDGELQTPKTCHTPMLNHLTEQNLTKSSAKQLQDDKKQLEEELCSTKSKLQKTKQRVNNLGQEQKELKKQIVFLIQKGKHDDELIESLVQRNECLQKEVTNMQNLITEREEEIERLNQELSSLEQRKEIEVDKLKEIIAEKNEHIDNVNKCLAEANQKENDSKCELENNRNGTPPNSKQQNNSSSCSFIDSEYDLVKSLTTERDGLLKLIEGMEFRIEELLSQKNALEIQNAQLARRSDDKHGTKLKSSTKREKIPNVSNSETNEDDTMLDYLLNSNYVKDVICQCNLSAHSVKIITKCIRELQTALAKSHDEIISLKGNLKLTSDYRKEDLKLVMQMVEEIRQQQRNKSST
uniref:Coiled-coil domain-containing protein 13 n=1 Tax=Trichobilharzia regenti TaxID=157069 RepID=A0AA85JER8_TRIRE|nr:unnamed protein product [Trichobilharzia regenti]